MATASCSIPYIHDIALCQPNEIIPRDEDTPALTELENIAHIHNEFRQSQTGLPTRFLLQIDKWLLLFHIFTQPICVCVRVFMNDIVLNLNAACSYMCIIQYSLAFYRLFRSFCAVAAFAVRDCCCLTHVPVQLTLALAEIKGKWQPYCFPSAGVHL